MRYKQYFIVDTLDVKYKTNFIQGTLKQSKYLVNKIRGNTFIINQINRHPSFDRYKFIYKVQGNNGVEIFDIGHLQFGHNYHTNIDFSYDKEFLYRSEFTDLIRDFEESFSLELNNITRIDISFDTNQNLIRRIRTLFNNKDIVLLSNRSKVEILPLNDNLKKGDKTPTIDTIRFRKKDKGLFLEIYNKSKHLKKISEDKEGFIHDYFSTRFGSKDTIYRMEVRIMNKILKKYGNRTDNTTEVTMDEIDLYRLEDKNYLIRLFNDYYPYLLDFRKLTNPNNIGKCKKIQFTNFSFSSEPNDRRKTHIIERRKINRDVVETKKVLDSFLNIYDNMDVYIKVVEEMGDKSSTFYHNRLTQIQKSKNPNRIDLSSYLE